jgi:hypothetical protein
MQKVERPFLSTSGVGTLSIYLFMLNDKPSLFLTKRTKSWSVTTNLPRRRRRRRRQRGKTNLPTRVGTTAGQSFMNGVVAAAMQSLLDNHNNNQQSTTITSSRENYSCQSQQWFENGNREQVMLLVPATAANKRSSRVAAAAAAHGNVALRPVPSCCAIVFLHSVRFEKVDVKLADPFPQHYFCRSSTRATPMHHGGC